MLLLQISENEINKTCNYVQILQNINYMISNIYNKNLECSFFVTCTRLHLSQILYEGNSYRVSMYPMQDTWYVNEMQNQLHVIRIQMRLR